jgi:AcrR family transcriptional regulator
MTQARRLFAERGYAGVSADDIVAAAGLTRGALHHHFGDKAGLFRAVFEQLEAELVAESATAVPEELDLAARMVAGVGAFLDSCERPEVLRISLLDAPAVLGWDTWRAIETEYGLGLVEKQVEQGIAAGWIAPQPVEVLAQLVFSLMIEAALLIANGADRRSVEPTLLAMLSGMVVR